jgi:chorismate dehydratase
LNRKIRIGAVNYLNTKPLIYGLKHGGLKEEVEVVEDYPTNIAAMLLNDEIDVGLVPVAIIPEMKEHYIISDYCIGCDGEVGSVCLFSEVPLENIEKVLLDYQSKTSVDLLKILIKQYWRIDPLLISTFEDYRKDIKDSTAGLIIGDRALEQRNISKYRYDLGTEWKKYTGLPFVFAAWISNKEVDPSFIRAFNKANLTGIQQIDKVVQENPYEPFDLRSYYTSYMNYHLDENAKKGLAHFLDLLHPDKSGL